MIAFNFIMSAMKMQVSSSFPGFSLAFPPVLGYNISDHFSQEDLFMDNQNIIPEEEEVSVLTLTDENGNDVEFEYLDCIEYEGKEYLVLMPAQEDAEEIVILEVEPVDEEMENYLSVSDEAVLDAVYQIFKEKFKDVLTFED